VWRFEGDAGDEAEDVVGRRSVLRRKSAFLRTVISGSTEA